MNNFPRTILHGAPLLLILSLGYCCDSNVNAGVPAAQIYWADTGNKILRAELDGSNLVPVISGLAIGNIGDFVIDRRTNLVYINDAFNIYRSNLDSPNLASIFQFPPLSLLGDVTIDPLTNRLFFAEPNNNIIYRSNLDGSDATAILPASGMPPSPGGSRELWLDSSAGKLYWSNASRFHRMNLDGSQNEVLFTTPDGIGDFEIDPQQGKIYWTADSGSQNSGTVRRANLNGTQQEILVSGLWAVGGIALDVVRGKMYYTDAWGGGLTGYDSTIRVANLDGTSQKTIINLGPSVVNLPFEITLDTAIVPEPACCSLIAVASLVAFAIWRRPTGATGSARRCRLASERRVIK